MNTATPVDSSIIKALMIHWYEVDYIVYKHQICILIMLLQALKTDPTKPLPLDDIDIKTISLLSYFPIESGTPECWVT